MIHRRYGKKEIIAVDTFNLVILGINVVAMLSALASAKAGHHVWVIGKRKSLLRVYRLTTYDLNVISHIVGGSFVDHLIEEGLLVFDKHQGHWHIHLLDLEKAIFKACKDVETLTPMLR